MSIHVSLSAFSLHICIGGQNNPYNKYRTNIEDIAVSVELQCLLKVKEDLT